MFDPATSAFTTVAIPTAGAVAVDIAPGPGGDLYFTEFNGNQIGVINPATHVISESSIPTAESGPWGITAGPNQSVWFTESSSSKVGVDFGSHLVFTVQPSGPVTAGTLIGLTVSDVDSSGTVEQNYSGQATITLTGGPRARRLMERLRLHLSMASRRSMGRRSTWRATATQSR